MAHADRKAAGCYLFNSLIHLHMQLHELLAHYAGYDLWANHRFVERLEQETDELLDREVKSSFPSLRETVLHIRNAEHTWLCRIKGEAYQWPAEPETSIDRLVHHSKLLHDHVLSLSDQDPVREVEYADLRGNKHRQKVWEILMHCFNHSTQHRGQLITMMRSLGLDHIPANDLVVYQRQLRAKL